LVLTFPSFRTTKTSSIAGPLPFLGKEQVRLNLAARLASACWRFCVETAWQVPIVLGIAAMASRPMTMVATGEQDFF
jgi:hypothetical protein